MFLKIDSHIYLTNTGSLIDDRVIFLSGINRLFIYIMFSIHYKNMFLKREKIGTNVSELVTYLLCPRKLYYTCRGHEAFPDVSIPYVEHLMLKELAMNLPELLISCSSKDDELLSQFDALLSQVAEELPLIYSTELEAADSSIIEEAGSQLRSQIATMADNIRSLVSDAGKSSLLRQMKSAEAGSLLCSDKLDLCGIPHLVLSE